jgi:hypothetical protein
MRYQPLTTNHEPPTTNHEPRTTNHQPEFRNAMKYATLGPRIPRPGRENMKTLIALGILMLVVAESAFAQTTKTSSLAGLSTQPSMNVFRRFSVDAAKMTGFYGDVLGLKALPPLRMPGGGSMILFQVGSGQVKLQATPAAKDYASGPVRDVSGLRVFTFFFPD